MTCYPTQSHYPDTEPTSPRPILIMLSARLGSDKSLVSLDPTGSGLEPREVWIHPSSSLGDRRSTHLATPSGLCDKCMQLVPLLHRKGSSRGRGERREGHGGGDHWAGGEHWHRGGRLVASDILLIRHSVGFECDWLLTLIWTLVMLNLGLYGNCILSYVL